MHRSISAILPKRPTDKMADRQKGANEVAIPLSLQTSLAL
jgi:hypothetical protein